MPDNSLSTIPWLNGNQEKGFNPLAKTDSRDRRTLIRLFEHKHMIETIERFSWKNLPPEIPSDLIERVLYFRFKGALFKSNDKHFFLPFTLKGDIDSYGRYIAITPVLFTGQWKTTENGITQDIAFMSNLAYKVVYDLPQEGKEGLDEIDLLEFDDQAVILTDSSLEISQDYVPMNYLVRPLVEQLVDILVLVNIDLITSAKVFYVVAKDPEQKEAIEKEFRDLDQRILNGKRIVVVTSATELKELAGSNAKDSARYFQSFQSIDNLRKDIIGQSNGGTFMKQEHTTQMETETNSNAGSLVLENALRMRKEFCTMANKVFGLNIDVEIKGGSSKGIISPEGSQTKDRRGEGDE